MPLFVFISGYFSKNLEKRRKAAFEGLLISYLLAQIVIGLTVLVTDRNLNILRNPLFASYGTWYLIALYIWRTLMPDLVKIKRLMVFTILAFFATPFFWRMGNTLGLQRTVGFFCFFLMGYYCSEKDVLKAVRIPKVLCIGIYLIELVVLYICFDIVGVPHVPVFMIFAHGYTIFKELWQIPFIAGGYVVAFILAIFNSILFINLFFTDSSGKGMNYLSKIGEDTMLLYMTHLALIKIFAALMRPLPDIMYLVLAVPVGIGFVVGLSSNWYRNRFNGLIRKIVSAITVKEVEVFKGS